MKTLLSFFVLMASVMAGFGVVAQEEASDTTPKKPVIMIFGKEVMTTQERQVLAAKEAFPDTWEDPARKRLLKNRVQLPYYEHSPSIGPDDAPLLIVEMTDLSCVQCMDVVRRIEDVRAKYDGKVKLVHVHLPVDLYNATNPAAFYGRIASKAGTFWEYRAKVIDLKESPDNIYTEKLVETGLDRDTIRRLIRDETRRAYRELDADTMLGKKEGLERPPVYFINGVKVDADTEEQAIWDLVDYELALYKEGVR